VLGRALSTINKFTNDPVRASNILDQAITEAGEIDPAKFSPLLGKFLPVGVGIGGLQPAEAAGLLAGDATEVPELSILRAAVEAVLPPPAPRQVAPTIDAWLPAIRADLERGVGPQAIWDRLRRQDPSFTGSISAVKRAARRAARERGVRAEDVVIPVETEPGDVAQLDFGFAGRFFDPATGLVRKAWVFVMVLAYSRHMFARIVYDQKATTWVALAG